MEPRHWDTVSNPTEKSIDFVAIGHDKDADSHLNHLLKRSFRFFAFHKETTWFIKLI